VDLDSHFIRLPTKQKTVCLPLENVSNVPKSYSENCPSRMYISIEVSRNSLPYNRFTHVRHNLFPYNWFTHVPCQY